MGSGLVPEPSIIQSRYEDDEVAPPKSRYGGSGNPETEE